MLVSRSSFQGTPCSAYLLLCSSTIWENLLMLRQMPKSRRFVLTPQKSAQAIHRLLQAIGIQGPCPIRTIPHGTDLPDTNLDTEQFTLAYLAAEILSKFDDGMSSGEKEAEAARRFLLAEDICRQTNRRLFKDRRDPKMFEIGSDRHLFWLASRKIASILGPFDWNRCAASFGWGPGSSTRLPRSRGAAAYKYGGIPHSTSECLALADAAVRQNALWRESPAFPEGSVSFSLVDGNKVITVPKNYKTHRTIAVEPDMNMFVQKGLGDFIRRRLRAHGVDLNSQVRNQELARKGSSDNTLATIDFSMASDTVAYQAVVQLLPLDVVDALEQCRCSLGVLASGERLVYQKFSSMGNGYTFELESLIFYGLALAVAEHLGCDARDISVYGDDVIVPSEMAPRFLALCAYTGFVPNAKKTFVDGPFRESCGKHFLRGVDVSPFYVKRELSSLSDVFLLYNQIYRFAGRCRLSLDTKADLKKVMLFLRAMVPSSWRKPRLPDGYGDGAFIGTFDECTPQRASKLPKYLGFEGFLVTHLAAVSEEMHLDTHSQLIASIAAIRGPISFGPEGITVPCESGGGVTKPPRMRAVTTLVSGFPGLDPFRGIHPELV